MNRAASIVLGCVRALVGASFAVHGSAILFGTPAISGVTTKFAEWPGWWAGLIELVGGAAVAIGLATRAAALLCSGSMAYAFLTVHLPHGVLPINNGGEPAAMFCWAFFLIAVLGPGAFAIDNALRGRSFVGRRKDARRRAGADTVDRARLSTG
ncbi:DoxX family protein [Skermania sp. ID1734]|uniref:DoxX family protein n=1 Tax=Skermania sp. ID1734 TaxID=2597516 RepID=UPI00117E87BE|nr:DoxX family protein [Skermania sp. ID1734]TSD94252.1 DoxX family protein [Skermania sp. ID1734]